ncbi:PREDICTED: uncharacterized protein LOC104826176 [Tarenaya hassleriana]|uniref:uncharacterized protein LOC104826176 n=1 Tax=Tarenaya hassleriana TaxID=28532 RepID=UPI00053C1C26|nr:PREDICTED: uncharacterized protein LOC104826176 [Tarenaya hassleriana]
MESSHQVPLHLCVFIFILLVLVLISWYASYEPIVEGFMEQVKLALMASPLLLLLAVHFLSKDDAFRRGLVPLNERESLYRAGGTPWGVAFLLVFLFFMLSYQSQFQERWFPLLAR